MEGTTMGPSREHDRQEAFAAFMEKVLADREVLALLLLILPLPSRERRERLDQLLHHHSCSSWTMDVQEIFDFLSDDLFAKEVFSYLRSTHHTSVPDVPAAAFLPSCKTTVIIAGKVVKCLEERPLCSYSFTFGTARFCAHPLLVPAYAIRDRRPAPFDEGNGTA